MKSLLVYQIEAVWQFCTDNNFTPYIVIDTTQEGIQVPVSYIKDNKIVLNISYSAVTDLHFDDEYISLKARFNGKSMEVFFPIESVLSIYSKETLEGVIFGSIGSMSWDSSPQIKARSPKQLKEEYDKKPKKSSSHLSAVQKREPREENNNTTQEEEEKVVSLDAFRSKKKK